ncbi:MAG: MoaD/ThiS family protein [Candidatus Anstonellales archaeon]
MAKVKVKFVGLSYLTNNHEEVEIEVKDVQSLIEELALRYKRFKEEVIDKNTKWISSNFIVLLNNVVIHENRSFKDGDTLSIIPAISGGFINA